jgi:hypothetical protein
MGAVPLRLFDLSIKERTKPGARALNAALVAGLPAASSQIGNLARAGAAWGDNSSLVRGDVTPYNLR